VRSVDELRSIVSSLLENDAPIAFDLETGYDGPAVEEGSLSWHSGAYIVGCSFSADPSWARYVPLRHEMDDRNLPEAEVWEVLKPLLEQPRIIAHHAKFESTGLAEVGIKMGVLGCTLLQAFVLSEWKSMSLKSLVAEVFGHQMMRIEELFASSGPGRRRDVRFNFLPLRPEVVAYACEDAAWTLELWREFAPKVESDPGLASIYRLELAVLPLLVEMERRGVAVDWEAMERSYQEVLRVVEELEAEVREKVSSVLGRAVAVNLRSPAQLRKVLFDPPPSGFGLSPTRETSTGQASTDELSLQRIARDAPIGREPSSRKEAIGDAVRSLLHMREADNLRKRFEVWLDFQPGKPKVRGRDGRVHPVYAQHVVGTGRLAAERPAIQQLPKAWRFTTSRGEYVGNFRDFIIAERPRYLIGFDFSQIELRAIAGLAQEKTLLEAFERGQDVHSLTASMMLGVPLDRVGSEQRAIGKTMNFALIYQMGVRGLAQRLGVPLEEARRLYDAYFASMPAIAAWVEQAKVEAHRRTPPHTRSWFGRKWTIWNLVEGASHAQIAAGERQAVNAPVQGWAADYVKVAMVREARHRQRLGWDRSSWLVMNQHDALVYEVDPSIPPGEFIRQVRPQVEFEVPGFPAMRSEWEWGYRWGSMVPVSEETRFVRDDEGLWQVEGGSPGPGSGERRSDPEVEVEASVPEEQALTDVVVEVHRSITKSEVLGLVRLARRESPGGYRVVLRLPEGDVVVWEGSGLGPASALEVRGCIPGAEVYVPGESLELGAEVLEGIL
jgi:DNA polymerase-1